MKRTLLTVALSLMIAILAACRIEPPSYDVYVTVYPMAYLVEEIGKGVVSVGTVPGVASHEGGVDWSPKDIIAMQSADLLFYVGAQFDAYVDDKFESLFQNQNVELVKIETAEDATGTLYVPYVTGQVHVHGTLEPAASDIGLDPHFWISPKRMLQAARLVRDKLIESFPDDSQTIQTSYEDLVILLSALDRAYEATIASQTKAVMTATNIYTYLHEDYGFESFSISPGYHEETEQFTTQEKEAIVAEALNHDIRHILFERNSSSPLSEAVLQSLHGEGVEVARLEFHILHALFSSDIEEGKNYLSIMQNNLQLIQTAGTE